MSLNSKPTLFSILAFDAEFGTTGKETIEAPVLKFSWRDGLARKNRVVIRDYDSNEITYDCTITTMTLKHQLHNKLDTSDKVQTVTYNLQNGHKYIANVYVFTELDGEPSLASNDVVFYCFNTPTFEFINFDQYVGDNKETAIVENNSINLRVRYEQTDGEVLSRYNFILKDYNGSQLLSSDTKYGSLSSDILRYTIGGIEATPMDKYGNIQYNQSYTITCIGETVHGLIVSVEQKFIVKLDNSGVGSALIVNNIGDGNVSITSNYRIINSRCSVENPTYELDTSNKPYAINLTNGETVEFLDGFIMKDPYEIVMTGIFQLGEIVHLTNADGLEASINYCKCTYTNPELYYFSFCLSDGNSSYEIRTRYFNIEVINPILNENGVLDLSGSNVDDNGTLYVNSYVDDNGTLYILDDDNNSAVSIDLSYKNGFYNIQTKINGEVY